MTRTLGVLVPVVAACMLAPAVASADVTIGPDGTATLPVITIVGRANRPGVTIVLQTPTASQGAAAAHDELRATLLARSQPSALRSQR